MRAVYLGVGVLVVVVSGIACSRPDRVGHAIADLRSRDMARRAEALRTLSVALTDPRTGPALCQM